MKKLCLAVFILLLFTGCDIEYNLDVNKYIEDASVAEYDSNNWDYTMSALSISELNDYYSHKPVALDFSNIDSENMDRLEDVEYYDVEDLSNDDRVGLSFHGKFKKDNSNSTLVWQACKQFSIKKYNDSTHFSAGDFKIFNQYENLNKITINLKSDNGDLSNNADSVKNNVYTWVITRDNYFDKKIDIKISNKKTVPFFSNVMVRFAFVIIILILLVFIVYMFSKHKNKKSNTF